MTCIIDDDRIFIYGIKKMLELVDFCDQFLVYRNGREALDSLLAIIEAKDELPDVILLDLNMPVLDGWQFLDEFVKVKVPKKITTYIVSSSVNPDDMLRAKSYSNVSNYIVKPITLDRVKELTEELSLN